MNMGEAQRRLEGPTYPCDCGDVYHFPENLAVHKTACQMSKVKAALDAKTKESAGWEAERDRYRAECMDLRVAVEIRERNIGELTFQLRDANLQIDEARTALRTISAGGVHKRECCGTTCALGCPVGIADHVLGVIEKPKCDHDWREVALVSHAPMYECYRCRETKIMSAPEKRVEGS